VLADFSQIAVARDLSPSVKILDQTYADFDQMAIRVVARYDAAPLNPQAVVVLRGITCVMPATGPVSGSARAGSTSPTSSHSRAHRTRIGARSWRWSGYRPARTS
jgi:hypothetical protein